MLLLVTILVVGTIGAVALLIPLVPRESRVGCGVLVVIGLPLAGILIILWLAR